LAEKSEVLIKRKQQLVQDAIWNAAIDLFAVKGFDAATVDEIAAAAGISQRTFFRYFASKSDLMGQGILAYGEAIRGAIHASPKSSQSFEVLRRAVLEVAAMVASSPRTHDVIAIVVKCPAAREAQLSRMDQLRQSVALAYSSRMKKGREDELTARLLAGLTLTILDETVRLWSADGTREISTVAEQVMKRLCGIVAGVNE
jgi:AcrR family transcriptional regulator